MTTKSQQQRIESANYSINAALASERGKLQDAHESFEESELLRRSLVNELESERNPGSDGSLAFHLGNVTNELATERQRIGIMGQQIQDLQRERDSLRNAKAKQREEWNNTLKDLAAERKANRGLYIESNKRYQQLLSAQAAIEDSLTCIPDHFVAFKILRKIDLSLLHQHDAELRKPLVDLLLRVRELMPDATMKDLKDRIDALAKVKK